MNFAESSWPQWVGSAVFTYPSQWCIPGVGVSTPCGAASPVGETVFAPGLLEL